MEKKNVWSIVNQALQTNIKCARATDTIKTFKWIYSIKWY